MYFVMSAEEVDGHVEPFLHAICETEKEAREAVEHVVRSLGIEDNDDKPIQVGTNDLEKWEDHRYDEDGLIAWQSDGSKNVSVMAKFVDMTKLGICA